MMVSFPRGVGGFVIMGWDGDGLLLFVPLFSLLGKHACLFLDYLPTSSRPGGDAILPHRDSHRYLQFESSPALPI